MYQINCTRDPFIGPKLHLYILSIRNSDSESNQISPRFYQIHRVFKIYQVDWRFKIKDLVRPSNPWIPDLYQQIFHLCYYWYWTFCSFLMLYFYLCEYSYYVFLTIVPYHIKLFPWPLIWTTKSVIESKFEVLKSECQYPKSSSKIWNYA